MESRIGRAASSEPRGTGASVSPDEGWSRLRRLDSPAKPPFWRLPFAAVLIAATMISITQSAAVKAENVEGESTSLRAVEALESRESAVLPPARIVGDFNRVARRHGLDEKGPGYRNFCSRMAWAPDRRRAFYAGANHGVPHRLNDVWEYDLAENVWRLLYAPDPSVRSRNRDRLKQVRELREHVLRNDQGEAVERVSLMHTKRGGPAHLSHTYWGFTYDPGREALLWNIVYGNRQGSYEGLPLWSYRAESNRWEPLVSPSPRPRSGGISVLEYVPALDGVVRYSADWQAPGMWLLPSDSREWRELRPNDGKRIRKCENCPSREAVFADVPGQRMIVAVEGAHTYHYRIDKNRWELVVDGAEEGGTVPRGHYGSSVLGYDPGSDRLLLYSPESHPDVWAYDPESTEWTRRTPEGPPPPAGHVIGYVDPVREVLVLNRAREVWVYRH